jgi:hypothetical protein
MKNEVNLSHPVFTISMFDTVQGCIYNIYKAPFSPGSVQQIMPWLLKITCLLNNTYIKVQFVPHRKHHVSTTKINWLILFEE